jgi:hypothetical protein
LKKSVVIKKLEQKTTNVQWNRNGGPSPYRNYQKYIQVQTGAIDKLNSNRNRSSVYSPSLAVFSSFLAGWTLRSQNWEEIETSGFLQSLL